MSPERYCTAGVDRRPDEDHPGTRILHADQFATSPSATLRCVPDRPTPERTTTRHPFPAGDRPLTVEFGAVSSLFDFLTFGALLWLFRAGPVLFRTGWFVESLLTELAVALVVRTRRPFFRSRPGGVLLWSTVALIGLTLAVPYVPFAGLFGFVPLPGMLIVTVTGITVLYVAATEVTKGVLYRGVA